MDKPKNEKSFLDQIREVNEKERLAEEEAARLQREERAQLEKARQEEYNKKLQQERVELMQLRQGIIKEPELIKAEERVQRVYTPKEKISNFFYHNKLYVILVGSLAILAAIFIYDMATTVRPDANVLIISSSDALYLKTDPLQELFEGYATDFNGDEKIYVPISYIPTDDRAADDPQVFQANITRAIGEMQSNDSVMLIASMETLKHMELTEYMVNMKERYPEKDSATEYGILIENTRLKEKLGVDQIDNELYLCVQSISENSYDKVKNKHENALAIVDAFMRDVG